MAFCARMDVQILAMVVGGSSEVVGVVAAQYYHIHCRCRCCCVFGSSIRMHSA